MLDKLKQRLEQQAEAGLWRKHHVRTDAQDKTASFNGKTFLNFTSNDYLGLANHEEVKQAFIETAKRYGVGSGSANTFTGYTQQHDALASDLASWLQRDKALLFSSGYLANIAILTTLVQPQDIIFADKANHASLNDGMRFSGAKFKRFAYNKLQNLEQELKKYPDKQKWIVSEGIFSMEGHAANIPELVRLAKQYQAQLIIDDVHGLGVLGETGAGSLQQHGFTQEDAPILMGGFGKAFGTQGAFVAGPKLFIDTLMQFARPYIYTTAMAPALVAATHASLLIMREDQARRTHLQALIAYFKQQALVLDLKLLPSETAIQAVVFESIAQLQTVAKSLREAGILVSAARFPTVPKDSPRLRISLNANHDFEDIDKLLITLRNVIHAKTSLATDHC